MHGKIGHLVPIGADDEQVLFRLLPDIECLGTIILLDTRTPAVPRSFDRALAGGVSKPTSGPQKGCRVVLAQPQPSLPSFDLTLQ